MFSRMPRLKRSKIVATTKDNRSFEGVLTGTYRDLIVLSHAFYLLENGQREQLVGEVMIPRDNLSFFQAGD